MRFSICIPTYEMHGQGVKFLAELFASIEKQTCQDFEVIVSDHSVDDRIARYCATGQHRFPVQYLAFAEKRGNASANINHAISTARGEIIKPMHQDDFFHHPRCLELIDGILLRHPEVFWGACGFIHTNEDASRFFRKLTPQYSDKLIYAENTMGAPAVMFYRNSSPPKFFDEQLIWMNDCELYYRFFHEVGGPIILPQTLIAIRQWPNQVTNNKADALLREREKSYVLDKYHLPKQAPPQPRMLKFFSRLLPL